MSRIKIHIDRLDQALKSQKVSLKRAKVLEIAAQAFGAHNSHEVAAAAKRGDLDPPIAEYLGHIASGDITLVAFKDPCADKTFAFEFKGEAIVTSPYSGLVTIPVDEIPPTPAAPAAKMIYTAWVETKNEDISFSAKNEAELYQQLASWCREYWKDAPHRARDEIDLATSSDREIVDAYFHENDREFLVFRSKKVLDRSTAPTNAEDQQPRYIIADPDQGAGWSHIFDSGEHMTRFVFDTKTNKLVYLEIIGSSIDPTSIEEIEDSLINANPEALERPSDYGLLSSNELPEWVLSKPVPVKQATTPSPTPKTPRKTNVHMARIYNTDKEAQDGGVKIVIGSSAASLEKKLADHARENWHRICCDENPNHLSNTMVCSTYFSEDAHEYVEEQIIALDHAEDPRAEIDEHSFLYLTNAFCEGILEDYKILDQLGLPYEQANGYYLYPLTENERRYISSDDYITSVEAFDITLSYSALHKGEKHVCAIFEKRFMEENRDEFADQIRCLANRIEKNLADRKIPGSIFLSYCTGPNAAFHELVVLIPFSVAMQYPNYCAWADFLQTKIFA